MVRLSTRIIAGAWLLFTFSLGAGANSLADLKATPPQNLPPSEVPQAVVPFRMPNLWSDDHASCDPDFVITPPPGRYFILNFDPETGGTTTSWGPDPQAHRLRQPHQPLTTEHLSTTESRLLNWGHEQSHLQGCRR